MPSWTPCVIAGRLLNIVGRPNSLPKRGDGTLVGSMLCSSDAHERDPCSGQLSIPMSPTAVEINQGLVIRSALNTEDMWLWDVTQPGRKTAPVVSAGWFHRFLSCFSISVNQCLGYLSPTHRLMSAAMIRRLLTRKLQGTCNSANLQIC